MYYIDNDTLLYPVGKHFALHNFRDQTQKFIMETDLEHNIMQTTMTVSPDGTHMAVGEICEVDISRLSFSESTSKKTKFAQQPSTIRVCILCFLIEFLFIFFSPNIFQNTILRFQYTVLLQEKN